MSARTALRVALLVGIGAFVYWVATHTYWADQVVPRNPRGAALSEPFYAAERLARTLGAHTSYERLWRLPAEDAVVVTAYWDWDRSSTQRAQLEQWVASGGRLVTDLSFLGHTDAFSAWSGVTRRFGKHARDYNFRWKPGGCRDLNESGISLWPEAPTPRHYQLCGLYGYGFLATKRATVWQVSDTYGLQAVRISIGRGSVTVVNGEPFTYLQFLKGTHPALFVAATQLHTGDEIYFLSDEARASLVALAWGFGAPVVVLLLGALGLALWRAAPRFGPALPEPESARRSLAEQIRGTGQFLLRVGDGEALHAATVSALFAAAPRRISAFATLSSAERVSQLARATGFSAASLEAAVNYTGAGRANELRSAIALLEAARREILSNHNRSSDGN